MREHELRNLEEGGGGGLFGDLGAAEAEGVPPGFLDQMKEAARDEIENREFFEEIPVLSALRATWDGTLWIQRRGEEPWDASGPIDVMRADGRVRRDVCGRRDRDPGRVRAGRPGRLHRTR